MTTQTVDLLYSKARKLHDARQLAEAREAYLAVLRAEPDHARALHALGNLDLRAGKLADAERLVRRALELEPLAPGFRNSLGNVLRARGDVEGAVAAYNEELRARPDFAATHHQLALLALDQGQLDEALRRVQKAIFYAPKNVTAYNTMGRIYNNAGDVDAARQAFQRALVFDPGNADAHFGLGHLARRTGNPHAAVESFRTAARNDPRHPRAFRDLGITLLASGRPLDAIDAFERALTNNPNDAAAHFGLGVIFQERGMIEAATRHFNRAVTLDPDNADAVCNLGAVLRSQGFFDAAEEKYRRALELKPGHVAALSGLTSVLEMRGDYDEALALLENHVDADAPAELISVQATVLERLGRRDEGIALVERALAGDHHGDLDRAVLEFRLGTLCDHAERYDDAWRAFEAGNARIVTDYDAGNRERVVDQLLEAFAPDALARLPRSQCPSERPIFIVGMPRSGTSLVEQILASHPDVYGAGELNTLGLMALGLNVRLGVDAPYPACLSAVSRANLDEMAGEYLARLDTLDTKAARVTDKMWQNYENLGLVEMLFPRARIIHCLRDPRDTLLSCYFQLFGRGGVPFSYSIDHLLSAWTQYGRLIRHWRKVLSVPMLEVRYETLVADAEPAIRRIVEFAGLDFDPACLAFHRTQRSVTTASYHQVRQPMYQRSVGRYRHYEPVMDSRLLALEPLEN